MRSSFGKSISAVVKRSLLAIPACLLVAACASAPEPEAEPKAETAVEPARPAEPVAAAPPPEPVPDPRLAQRVSFALVGDMMLGTDYPENILPDDDGVGFLADVADVLSNVDLAIGNLEGVLVDGGEPGKQCSNPKACYLFRSPTRYAEYYRAAGFDAMSVANNHARDFGEDGRSSTMAALDTVGIHHSGREGEFASFEHAGLRIAFLAYAVTQMSNLLFDYELAEATIADFAATHDIVVVSFHGGAEGRNVTRVPFAEEEYYGEPRGDVVRFGRMAVDAGADIVFGHGPHVIRAAEHYNERLIAYSLGNFATYYGISVEGIKGIAPILIVTTDGRGRFIEGEIVSTRQIRPAGPSIDREAEALKMLDSLSRQDFGNPGIAFREDGRIEVVPRPYVKPHPGPDAEAESSR